MPKETPSRFGDLIDIKDLASATVDLWEHLERRYKKVYEKDPSTPIMVCLMERADAHIITEIINNSKGGSRSAPASSGPVMPSQKQLAYAEDLKINVPEGCTKDQLSKLISSKLGG